MNIFVVDLAITLSYLSLPQKQISYGVYIILDSKSCLGIALSLNPSKSYQYRM